MWETEAGRSLGLRPAWSTRPIPGQIGLYRETLSKIIITIIIKKKKFIKNNKNKPEIVHKVKCLIHLTTYLSKKN